MPDQNADHTKIIERIQRLLAMAKDSGSPNEAAIAAKRAEALMRKHQLDHAEVMVNELSNDDVDVCVINHNTIVYGPKYSGSRAPTWSGVVAVGVAKMNDCEVTRDGGNAKFYGVGGDAQVAAEIYKYLILEVVRLTKLFPGDRGEKEAFRRGCAGELQRRCYAIARERQKEFANSSSGTALVVLKNQLIEQSTGMKFRYSQTAPTRNAMAAQFGREAGKKISLHRQVSQRSQGKIR